MSAIKCRNTRPELCVRRVLREAGFGYRLNRKDLPGSPDIVMAGRRIVIFVNGCFWHRHEGCRFATTPGSRLEFWAEKFRRNVERDRKVREELAAAGWRVLTVWECALRTESLRISAGRRILEWLQSDLRTGEIGEEPMKEA